MKARHVLAGVCLAFVVGTGAIPGYRADVHAQIAASRATLTAHAGTIAGTALDGNDQPIPAARLRLRDLERGRSLMTTRGDQEGHFRFTGVPAGSYLVELVDESGNVRAVSHTFAIAPGEMAATFVRLGARVPWYAGFFRNAAAAAVSSAAGLGVTAVGSGAQPASGRF